MIYVLLNIASLCIALAAAETLHGIIRAAIIVPRIGKKAALKVSIFSGSILAFVVCYYFVPKIGISDSMHLLGIGFILAIFMASFDIALAKIVLKRPVSKSINDFNPRTGNYLIFGLALLIAYPLLVMLVR